MRKILLGLVITGFALVVFITVKPLTTNLLVRPEAPATEIDEELLFLEPARLLTVAQGDSARALKVTNNMTETVSFSLGHEHAHLTFRPQGDRIEPGVTREIMVYVDPECPAGEFELPVYLRVEVNGERFGIETSILLNVVPGELSLESRDGRLEVLWNGGPASGGVLVSYRFPGEQEWQFWGEIPRIDPPRHIEPGNHRLEFKAALGEVVSAVKKLDVIVEKIAEKEPPNDDSDSDNVSGADAAPQPAPEPEEEVVEEEKVPLTRSREMLKKSMEEQMLPRVKNDEDADKDDHKGPDWIR